jgi:copper chaperone NosL
MSARRPVLIVAAALAIAAAACAPDTGPVEIVIGQDACASCRMVFTSVATAAELVTPGETPQLFDDLGCLRDYLRAHPLTADVALYVREHRQRTWIDGRQAEYSQTMHTSTPMASGIVAHVDAASRDADPAAAGARRLDAGGVIGSGERGRP